MTHIEKPQEHKDTTAAKRMSQESTSSSVSGNTSLTPQTSLIRFDPDTMNWIAWKFRFKNYVKLTDFAQEKRSLLLIESLETKPFQMLMSMCSPGDPAELSLDELFQKLDTAYLKVTFQVTEWAKFFSTKQHSGEDLIGFANRLRDLTVTCSFDDTMLDKVLSAVFVCGIQDERTRRFLMSQELKLFHETMTIARRYEASQTATTKASESVNILRKKPKNGPRENRSFSGNLPPCPGCGGRHKRSDCPFRDQECRKCHKKGHIQKVCRSKGKVSTKQITNWSTFDVLKVNVNQVRSPAKVIPLKVNGHQVSLKGACNVTVAHHSDDDQNISMRLLVVQRGTNLLGRDWLDRMNLDVNLTRIQTVNSTQTTAGQSSAVSAVLEKNRQLFRDDFGCCKTFQAHLHLKEGATPKFCKARPLPFALKEAVETDIERLLRLQVIRQVDHSEWAAPIVAVQKPGRAVRICADLSTGLNQSLDVHKYPLPLPDELFAKLNGGQKFSKLDLSDAYLQVPLDEESQRLIVINTHKGLFQYQRLPFGVASAPSIFQQLMDTILLGCDGAAAYMDDIIITGANDEEHLANLDKVLRRLNEAGLVLKEGKCKFMADSVEYLGFVIDRNGRHISRDKVKAVLEMPRPQDISQLRSFLGMINHYAKFIPNLSTRLDPFHKLLQKEVEWNWDERCEKHFNLIKQELGNATMLVHFNPKLPVILAADASPTGIGAVISHRCPGGTEKPIAHASKTLTTAEKNYAQIEKEALGLVFGVKKFHQYLAGREFTLLTDHKPLVSVFGSKQGIPSVTANRLQRWAIVLMGYTFTIEYRETSKFGQADGLSRLPLTSKELFDVQDMGMSGVVYQIQVENLENTPVSANDVKKATDRDPILSQVRHFILSGWPKTIPEQYTPFYKHQNEMAVTNGCILWGIRTVIPERYRKQLLAYLHATHAGMIRMKHEARSHFWWPNIDDEIEQMARSCTICAGVSRTRPKHCSSGPQPHIHRPGYT